MGTPPEPATGRGWKGPDEWARECGYGEGKGAASRFSVAAGAPIGLRTLWKWREAHYSILGAYLDVGIGRCGDTWVLYLGGHYWAGSL